MRESFDCESNEEIIARMETEYILVPRVAQLLLNELVKKFPGEFKTIEFKNAGTTVISWRLACEKLAQEPKLEIKKQIQSFTDGWFAAIDINGSI